LIHLLFSNLAHDKNTPSPPAQYPALPHLAARWIKLLDKNNLVRSGDMATTSTSCFATSSHPQRFFRRTCAVGNIDHSAGTAELALPLSLIELHEAGKF